LATGVRITKAADDPAGFRISVKLKARSRGLGVALDNISDAKNMLAVAEGGLTKIKDLLLDIRDKISQAANDTMGIEERLAISMKSYMPLFYAMHRTSIVKKIFSDNYNTNVSHAILNELSVSLYSLTFGKHKKMDMLTYVRDMVSESTPVERDNLKEISKKEEFREELNQFKLNLLNLISNENNSLDAKKIVDSSLSIYINQVKSETVWKSMIKKYFYFLLPVIRYFRMKRNRKLIIKKYFNKKGYPLSNPSSIDSWKNIQKVLKLHKF